MRPISNYVIGTKGKGWISDWRRDGDLLFLAWGERRYGKKPHGVERHPDWIYIAPQGGSPQAIVNGEAVRLRSGQMLIVAPGATLDMKDTGENACRIQTWVWRTAPEFEELRPTASDYLLINLSSKEFDELREIHRLCRYEIRGTDPFSQRALQIHRNRLELCLVRAHAAVSESPEQLFQRATDWLKAHPQVDAYIEDLCDYLRVSESALNRLFTEQTGYSPQKAALKIRLTEARRLISEGWSVKATAYHLKYQHPNDLSRALSRSPREERML